MKFKIFALFCVVSLLFGVLCSCENVFPYGVGNTSHASADESGSSGSTSSLPYYDIPEDELIIAASDPTPFSSDSDSAGTVATSVTRRNDILAQQYGLSLRVNYYDEAMLADVLPGLRLGGIETPDLYCFSAAVTAKLMSIGMLADLSRLPGFETNPERDGGIGDSVYMVFDNSMLWQDSAYCVFYNRDLISAAGLADPASLVLSGKWTWQVFSEGYSQVIAANVMNKGSLDYGSDTFGYCFVDGRLGLPCAMWTSCAMEILDSTGAIFPDLEAQTVAANMAEAVYVSRAKYIYDGNSASEAFLSGRVGFMIYRLDYIKALYNSNLNWGVVPMPLRDKNTGAPRCYTEGDSLCLSVPANENVGSGELLSAYITASEASFGSTLRDSYVTMYSPDNTVTVMIERIIKSAFVNYELLYSGCYPILDSAVRTPVISAVKDEGGVSALVSPHREEYAKFAAAQFGTPLQQEVSE